MRNVKSTLGKIVERIFKYKKVFVILFMLLVVSVPMLNLSSYIMRILILGGIYMVLTLSLNLLTGFTGQVSLGHAAFYGIGAYTSALLSLKFGYSFLITATCGGIMAAIFGILLGSPTLKLQGSYLSIVTLGFCEIARIIELNWMSLTRGPLGLPGIPTPKIFGFTIEKDRGYYYLVVVLILITIFAIKNIINSRTGRAMIAIREDDIAAEAMGINIFKYKLLAFTISAFFAGLAGSFYAHYVTFIDPQSFTFDESIQILSMVILGGMGSIPGSIIGALVLVSIPEMLRSVQEYRMVIYGIVLVFMMLVRPQGLFGNVNFSKILKRLASNKDGKTEEVGKNA
ncbi:branched-chain amino acid ABC transporter permease [Clostridium peptidivorans]|uniref:branched-chain amino acid ABC transporter permease n=1 Tax=Clostridium peptidivorans TaxID=100174 RepID=UPI001FA833B7|nr:branched-chain amino acid ABC transporter permease [Clostridium peptidivorans]